MLLNVQHVLRSHPCEMEDKSHQCLWKDFHLPQINPKSIQHLAHLTKFGMHPVSIQSVFIQKHCQQPATVSLLQKLLTLYPFDYNIYNFIQNVCDCQTMGVKIFNTKLSLLNQLIVLHFQECKLLKQNIKNGK